MTGAENSDMVLVPDKGTYRRLPIFDSEFGEVAMFICNVHNPDGTPAKYCSRSILDKELTTMKKMNFDKMNIGFEPEFFLALDGKLLDDGDYAEFDIGKTAHIRREMMYEFERCDIVPLTSHHERSPSQFEITFKHEDAMRSCDNLVLYKIIAKAIANKHGLDIVFDPKPFENVNGNGCHTNISLEKNNKNAFASNSGLSNIGKHFMGGILEHANALTYLTNPTEESYKRLVPNCEAPTKICWGYHNRDAMIRIPSANGNSTRIELRSPDMTINPYLCVAGILRAGLDGIKREALWKNDSAIHLPNSLDSAKSEFNKSILLNTLIQRK